MKRPDCPPMLRYCLELLDKAYGFGHDETDEDEDNNGVDKAYPGLSREEAGENEDNNRDYKPSPIPPPYELTRLVGRNVDIDCFARVPGAKGHYTIPGKRAIGNSYVCFRADTPDRRWVAGQIQYIFKDRKGGSMKVAVRRSKVSGDLTPDPFSTFWEEGFEAKMVSSNFSNLEIIELSDIIAHTARWVITRNFAIVLNLSVVSGMFNGFHHFSKSCIGVIPSTSIYAIGRLYRPRILNPSVSNAF